MAAVNVFSPLDDAVAALGDGTGVIEVGVVGAGTAGLSAALSLARGCRKVIVFNNGEPPRNAPAPESHTFFTRDGAKPLELQRVGVEQLVAYATAKVVQDGVTEAARASPADPFVLTTASGKTVRVRKLILATGMKDELAAYIPAAAWGVSVVHCPLCGGTAYAQQDTVAVVDRWFGAMRYLMSLPAWSNKLSMVIEGSGWLAAEQRTQLEKGGFSVYEGAAVAAITTAAGNPTAVTGVTLSDGTHLPAAVVYYHPHSKQRSTLAESLGAKLFDAATAPMPPFLGKIVTQQPVGQVVGVPGLWAAGDCADPIEQVSMAAAGGQMAGVTALMELVRDMTGITVSMGPPPAPRAAAAAEAAPAAAASAADSGAAQ
jgi:thioredoxin reductase (NADPH)